MSVASRREHITKIFLSENKVKVGELAKLFGVTTETIRRDLIALEKQGAIRRGNGRAEVINELTEQDFSDKSSENIEKKKSIASYAATLLPENAAVFLDAGSTVYQLARKLIFRKDITAITNFLPIASLLSSNKIKVILIGGEVRWSSGGATGQLAIDAISQINADLAILSTSGFGSSLGPCVENFSDASVKRSMLQHSGKAILLTDSSKAGWSTMVNFAKWADFSTVVSDDQLPDEVKQTIQSQTELVLVPSTESKILL